MRNKKGFTLVELLATLVILGILLGIAVPAVGGYLTKGKISYYHGLETDLLAAGRDYVLDYRSLLPREVNGSTVVTVDELVKNNYIEEPKDEDGNSCNGQVTVIKTGKSNYDYLVCLSCGKKYQSETEQCEYVSSNGTAKDYEIHLNGQLPNTVNQGDPVTIPTAQVVETTNGGTRVIDDRLEGTPKSIDTTALGTTTISWAYRSERLTKVVQVVDSVAPVVDSFYLSYVSATNYDGSITHKDLVIHISAHDYACIAGSDCRRRYPSLEGSGIKAVYYKEKNATEWVIYNTTRTNITVPIKNSLWGEIEVKVVDASGNSSAVQTVPIQMDIEPPSKTTVNYLKGENTANWQSDISVQLHATDDIGIKYYEIYKDGFFYGTTGETWSPPNNFSSDNVTFRAVDLSGSKGEFSGKQKIHMDTEKPNIPNVNLNGYTSGVWTGHDIRLSFTAADNGTIDYYEYAESNEALEGTKISNPWDFTQDGLWTIYIRAVDSAGNKSDWSNEYSIWLDKVPPEAPKVSYLSGASSSAWQGNVRIQLDTSDNHGLKYYEIYKDDVYYGTTGPVWVPPNGFSSNHVTFKAIDIVGNKSEDSVVQRIHVNSSQPTLSESYWGPVTNLLAPLYIKVTDSSSGINRVQCQTSTSTGGYNNWHSFDAVWDASERAYRCDITPATFGHYNQIYLTNIYIYDNVGNGGYYNQEAVMIPSMNYKLSSVARPGDYVTYRVPSDSYTSPRSENGIRNQTIVPSDYHGTWQVLYNDENYGLQIVSSDVTTNLSVYGYVGMNNIYDTLNALSAAYMDGVYAISARHIGTNPSNSNDSSSMCMLEDQEVKCWEQSVYLTDLNALKNARSQNANGIASTSREYFFISRQKYACNEGGIGGENCYCLTDSRDLSGNTWSARCPVVYPDQKEVTNGVRPVIKLSSETTVLGSGTLQDPYVIQY